MVERLSSTGAVMGPEERVGARETALRAYTLDTAWASHDEHRRGSLAPGKAADLVLLAENPLEVATSGIGQIEVLATWSPAPPPTTPACSRGTASPSPQNPSPSGSVTTRSTDV